MPGKNSVDGGDIRKNAVTSADIKNNNVKGADVNEATLAKVPSAANADNAGSANSAGTVNGQSISKVNYRADDGAASSPIFNSGGLTISAACAANAEVALTATTTEQDSSIYSFVAGDAGPPAADPLEADTEGGGFDTTTTFNLLAGGSGNINFVHFEYDALDGTIATGTLAVDENGVVNDCLATGHVIVG